MFQRISEYEEPSIGHPKIKGSVVDSFRGQEKQLWAELPNKPLMLISPELHGRSHLAALRQLRSLPQSKQDILLCTDLPDAARDFFS